MINPRILLQFPMLLLGSCIPMVPMPPVPVERALPAININVTLGDEGNVKVGCLPSTYTLPPKPDVSKISPGNVEALTDVLLDNIQLLREELRRVSKLCQ